MPNSPWNTYPNDLSGDTEHGVESDNNASYLSRSYSYLPYQGRAKGNDPNLNIDEQNDNGRHEIDHEKRFACPFHKFDTHKYQSCEHYHLTNWSNTLQHLGRVHALVNSDINHLTYCPICRIQFKGKTADVEWQLHVRTKKCQNASIEETGMMLPAEFVKLKSLSKGFTNEQKWLAAWEKLFPVLAEPSSAYFESLADLLRRHAYERIRRFLGCDNMAVIEALVDEVFTPPEIPRKVTQSQVDVNVSMNEATGPAHINNWFAGQPLSLPVPSSAPCHTSGFPQISVMAQPFSFSVQPGLSSPLPEATTVLGIDTLGVDHDDAFVDLPLSEDWSVYTQG